jgi:uncharacterized membrane protein
VSATSKAARIAYVDRLRGLAVLGMFFVHSGWAWLEPAARDDGDYGYWVEQISGMVAPVFMFLAGLSVAILARRGWRGPTAERDTRRRVALRGIQILGTGYGLGLAFLVFDGFPAEWQRALRVDILHCIGISLALLPWCCWPRCDRNWPAFAAYLVLVFGAQLTWRLPLGDWLPDFVAGYLTREVPHSRFPLFPYAGWVALGMFVGPLWHRAIADATRERRFWIGLAISALVAFVLWLIGAVIHDRLGLDHIGIGGVGPVTTVHFFFFKTGVVLVLLAAARLSAPVLDRIAFGPLILLGQTSLFAYCVHLVIIYHVLGPWWCGRLTPTEHLLGTALLTVVMIPLCLAWRRLRH